MNSNTSTGEKRSMSSNPRVKQNSSMRMSRDNNSEIENEGDKDKSRISNMRQSFSQIGQNQTDNLRVNIRIRPPLMREIEEGLPFRSIAIVSNESKNCSLAEYLGGEFDEVERQREWVENPNLFQLHRFTFDNVFDLDANQEEVYEMSAKPAVLSMLEGYNSTIFAYGQTGTGKTYTMEGFTYSQNDPARGIIPRSIDEIFSYIESLTNTGTKFMVRASYLQIYNENISDLLKNEKSTLQIREDKKKGVFVEGLSEWAVRSPSDVYTLLQRGALNRNTSSTKMNDVSSRSHAVFVTTVEQMEVIDNDKDGYTHIKVGKLNLVDLAGSERIRVTGATGKQLEESKKINKSLSALGNVIYALTDTQTKGRLHIPYRDSKLTRLLEDSLGGNCKTTMIAMISPAQDSFSESLSTLHFARRAKNIKNKPHINEDLDQKALIRQYEIELKKLRMELEEKTQQFPNNDIISQLEEEKKQAEQDKLMAIDALEQASQKYFQEREQKKQLEAKIQMMTSQLLQGGHKIEDTPQFRSALAEKHSLLVKEFDMKFQDFERERQQLEHDKVQVEKYKSLLLKQKDIMIALTSKLNERDEVLCQFQEEVDAYDKICREKDEVIDVRTQRIALLENLLKRNNIKIPIQTDRDRIQHKKMTEKVYIPYQMEVNSGDYKQAPLSLMSADEKIKELTAIIQDKNKEISFIKDFTLKMSANTNSNLATHSNLNSTNKDPNHFFTTQEKDSQPVKSIQNTQKNEQQTVTEKYQSKINFLENEIENLLEIMYEKDNIINGTRNEFENLKSIERQNLEIQEDKKRLAKKIKSEFLRLVDRVNNDDLYGIQQEMIGVYNDIATLNETLESQSIMNENQRKQYNSFQPPLSNREFKANTTNHHTVGSKLTTTQAHDSPGRNTNFGPKISKIDEVNNNPHVNRVAAYGNYNDQRGNLDKHSDFYLLESVDNNIGKQDEMEINTPISPIINSRNERLPSYSSTKSDFQALKNNQLLFNEQEQSQHYRHNNIIQEQGKSQKTTPKNPNLGNAQPKSELNHKNATPNYSNYDRSMKQSLYDEQEANQEAQYRSTQLPPKNPSVKAANFGSNNDSYNQSGKKHVVNNYGSNSNNLHGQKANQNSFNKTAQSQMPITSKATISNVPQKQLLSQGMSSYTRDNKDNRGSNREYRENREYRDNNYSQMSNIGVIDNSTNHARVSDQQPNYMDNPQYDFKRIDDIPNNSVISNSSKNSSFYSKFLNK